jgi:hypothetical protein
VAGGAILDLDRVELLRREELLHRLLGAGHEVAHLDDLVAVADDAEELRLGVAHGVGADEAVDRQRLFKTVDADAFQVARDDRREDARSRGLGEGVDVRVVIVSDHVHTFLS